MVVRITRSDVNEYDECFFEDEVFNLSEIKDLRAENTKTKKSFLFSESMLDEFDPWLN